MSDPRVLGAGGQAASAAQCALVLEDNPVGADSRLDFQSFPPDGIEESYSVAPYREIGADRAPQPAEVAYRGGNWGPFNLKLQFRAGMKAAPGLPSDLDNLNLTDIEAILVENERRVNWCEALTFGLPRSLGSAGDRILARAQLAGVPTQSISESINKVQRQDPPLVLIVFGAWRVIRGYCSNWSVVWEPPFHPVSCRPYGASVSLTFQPIYTEYPTWQLIRNRADKGGATTNIPELKGTVVPPALADARKRAQVRAADNAAVAAGTPRAQPFGTVGPRGTPPF